MKKFLFLIFFFLSANAFCQWVNTNSSHFSETVTNGNSVFGIEDFGGVYLSNNNGANWSQIFNSFGLARIATEGSNIFVGTSNMENRGIYRSTNLGLNWVKILSPSELYGITSIAIDGNNIFVSTGYWIYHSTNNGTNWIQASNNDYVNTFAINGNNIFAGTEDGGVYLSTNNGSSWSQTSLNNRNITSLAINNNYVFAGTYSYGLYSSTNNGMNWAQTSLNNKSVNSLVSNLGNLFAGTDSGIYISKNNGVTWVQKNQGLSGYILNGSSLAANNSFIFASNLNSSTWRRAISDIIYVRQISDIIPRVYKLEQNYPNPFNPTTNIEFSLHEKSFVKLKIFDIAGKEIQELVNENFAAGTYKYEFNAEALPSGTYFYRLETDKFTDTKKMIVLK